LVNFTHFVILYQAKSCNPVTNMILPSFELKQ
jgi:hypothetical protein